MRSGSGELRPVQRGQDRIREAAKLGFRTAIIPVQNRPRQSPEGIEIVALSKVSEAIDILRE